MDEKRWYTYETRIVSIRDCIQSWLKRKGFTYQLSNCYGNYRFEMFLTLHSRIETSNYITELWNDYRSE